MALGLALGMYISCCLCQFQLRRHPTQTRFSVEYGLKTFRQTLRHSDRQTPIQTFRHTQTDTHTHSDRHSHIDAQAKTGTHIRACRFTKSSAISLRPSSRVSSDIGELLVQRSVLALVNGVPWDMHRPLVEDCELQFLHFKENDPSLVNQVKTL